MTVEVVMYSVLGIITAMGLYGIYYTLKKG